MSKTPAMPPIRQFMTAAPHTIGSDPTLARAHAVMREFRIRQLPVLSAERLVGVLSNGNLNLVETLRDIDPQTVLVEDAMTQDPDTVGPDTPPQSTRLSRRGPATSTAPSL